MQPPPKRKQITDDSHREKCLTYMDHKWKNWDEGAREELIAACSRRGYTDREIFAALKLHAEDPTPPKVLPDGSVEGMPPCRQKPNLGFLGKHLQHMLTERRRWQQHEKNMKYRDLSVVSQTGSDWFAAIRAELAAVQGQTRHMGAAGGAVAV